MQILHTFFCFSHDIFMKNTVGKGAFVLSVSGIICKFFGALFRLPLTNIIGIEGIGIFQMIMSLYSLMLVFVSSGVTSSLSKLVSSARARGENYKLGGYFRLAILFCCGLALAIGIIFAFLSKPIASLQGNANASIIYLLFVILLPLGAIIGVYRGIIQGYENMTPTAFSQIIEQVIKFVFGLFFAFILGKRGIYAGVFGAFLGIVLSEFLAFIYLYFVLHKNIKIKQSNYNGRKEFFSAVLPLSFSSAVLPLTHAIEALFIIVLFVKAGYEKAEATILYGLQTGVVGALLNFPLVISMSVAVALLPKIAFLSAENNEEGQREIIKKSFGAMWFLLIPLVLGLCAISKELYPIIYPNVIKGYLQIAVQLTFFSGLSIVLSSISQVLSSTMQAKGFYVHCLLFNLLGGIAKIALIFILVPIKSISVYAISISNIVMFSITCILYLIKLGSLIKIDFFQFVMPIMAGIVMFLSVELLLGTIGGILGIILSIIVGAIVYFVSAFPLTKEYAKIIINKISKYKNK